MEIYHYDSETGVYICADLADESPLETGVYLIPANATTLPPPVVAVGEAAIWNGSAWSVVTIPVNPPPAPSPDAVGFIQALKAALGGIVAANELATAYPLFFAAVQTREWIDVQALIVDAHTKAILTDAQYSDIKAAAVANNIPVTL